MKSLIYLLLITILLSCNSEDKVISSTAGDQDIVKLNVEVDEFTMLASSGRILRQSAQQDREAITSLMKTLRSSLTLLNINANDTNALRTVEVTLLELRSYKVSERDMPRLTGMYRQANNVLNKYSKIQGVEVNFQGDLLYQFDLADGTEENDVYPFGNVIEDGGGLWRRAESLDRYLVKTSGTDGASWLISPQFDFSNVEKPGLRIRQTINISENSSIAFNFQAIYNDVYQILVSEDYDKGDPSSGTWKVFDAPGIKPSGKDFHTVDSGVVSLEKYKGKKITLALKYSGGDAGGRHYLSWQIDRFEVSGVTSNFNYRPYKKEVEILPFFRMDFNELGASSLDKFTQETLSGDPGEFYVGEHQGNNYVRINKQNGLGVRRIYSESLNTFKELIKPAISINHNVKFYEVKEQSKKLLKLFIAKDEEGVNVQDLKWVDLNLNTENTGNSYNKVDSDWALFPEDLIGENVRVSFQWEGDGTIAPLWDIHQINIDEREGQE